ncbi:MAG: GntR family transcriptional regulator [Chloroflexi bacterium]|nr:GntR family transcriptional regulator [Chloroflexota bacterium]
MENQQPFHRLQSSLSKIIEQTPPGKKLPAEPLLAKTLGVSRATLREAMRDFESQGLILRRQGIGTFVVSHPHVIESGLEVLESIETLAGKIGLNVTMGDLQIDRIETQKDLAPIFDLETGTPLLRVRRTILTESRPVAYLIDILPENILKHSDLEPGFTGSVLDLLLRRGSPMLAKSIANIQAEAATSEVARALQIQRGDVLLVFLARLFEAEGKVVDYSTSYFLPGYFQFHVVRSLRRENL